MIAIADTSPIILLSKVGYLSFLRDLFVEVMIPPAVETELHWGSGDRPGVAELAAASWMSVRSVLDREAIQELLGELGPGEAEAIVLTEQMQKTAILLIDDAAGRTRARQRGLLVVGTAGILVQSKERGLIPLVRPILEELRIAGLYLSSTLYERFVSSVGE